MTNFANGQQAEQVATDYLKTNGYKIIDNNWRTKYCEIDIVAEKSSTIYFVEVKYRQSKIQGTGIDYITSKKLKQMEFSAEMWVQHHKWLGDYDLAVIEVSSQDFRVSQFISVL